MSDRRAVRNHLGTVHAIAMCNMAELAGGLMTDVTIPPGARWIPKGMEVAYLRKARGDLRAVATPRSQPPARGSYDFLADVEIVDREGTAVMKAAITMEVDAGRSGRGLTQPV